jgi:hypothetical protein
VSTSLAYAVALGEMVPEYVRLRAMHPLVPARRIVEFIKHPYGTNFEQFICRHEWVISEETDRSYCCYCGADGDA